MKKILLLCTILFALSANAQTVKSMQAPQPDRANVPEEIAITKLKIKYQPDPDAYYPSFSKRSGEEGKTSYRLIVDTEGRVAEVLIINSSGHPRLDRAGAAISSKYLFEPVLVKGQPIAFSTVLPINFRLAKPDDQPAVKKEPASGAILSPTDPAALLNLLNTTKEHGVVVVRLTIDESGKVTDVEIMQSSGNKNLDDVALKAGAIYLFSPYIINGKPVRIQTQLKLTF